MRLQIETTKEGEAMPIAITVTQGNARPINGTVRVSNFNGMFVRDITFANGEAVAVTNIKGLTTSDVCNLRELNFWLKRWPHASIARCASASSYSVEHDDFVAWELMAMGYTH